MIGRTGLIAASAINRYLIVRETSVSQKDKDDDKPVTLADYIPPASVPDRAERRKALTKGDRERLDALERAVRETEPDAVRRSRKTQRERDHSEWAENKGWKSKRKSRGSNVGKFVIWAILIMIALAIFLD